VAPPLIEECRAHLECTYAQHLTFGEELVLFGRIVACSVDEHAWTSADPYAYLRPVVFLEGHTYGVIERSQSAQSS
jgi:flavin reductase (DIM6/NTAB) family NADH-FMN oxidoreductase RutF